jgi:hypothetical protein
MRHVCPCMRYMYDMHMQHAAACTCSAQYATCCILCAPARGMRHAAGPCSMIMTVNLEVAEPTAVPSPSMDLFCCAM